MDSSTKSIRFEVDFPDGSCHRFRSGDAYDAWKSCVDLYNQSSKNELTSSGCNIEIVKTGATLNNAADFRQLFQEFEKRASFGTDDTVRLKVRLPKSLSFHLARDIIARTGSDLGKLAADERRVYSNNQASETGSFKLACDDFVESMNNPYKSQSTNKLENAQLFTMASEEKIQLNSARDSSFRLARDEDLLRGVRLTDI
jgi:hypothetical protein